MGARLIHRTSRQFAVTEIGQDFYRHAAAMLIEAEAAEQVIRGRQAEPSGPVRLTCSMPTAQMVLADALPDLVRLYPKLQISLHATDRFVDLVQEGYDIAIRAHFAPLPDSGLVQRRLAADPILLVASPDYLAAAGTPQTPDELSAHDGLLILPPGNGWDLRNADGALVSVRPRPVFCADESIVLLTAAARGLGIVAMPQRICANHLRAGTLARVLPGWRAGEVTTTLLTPHRRGQLPSVRAVVEFLIERLASGEGSGS
jgi:DNA-binding transcriptional LysR family regulator